MKCSTELTQERLKELFEYDPEIGLFIRKTHISSRFTIGDQAGTKAFNGYIYICANGRAKLAHRLAWLFLTGSWPKHQIDHIDGNRTNNRFNNLREATRSENQHNKVRQTNNSSGFKGVTWHKHNQMWRATIVKNRRQKTIGYFLTPKEAHEAYCEAAKQQHGEFANYGTHTNSAV